MTQASLASRAPSARLSHIARARADSKWAKARLAQCLQFKWQMNAALFPLPPDCREFPIQLHAVVWWDEHHKKVRLGHARK